MTGKLSTLAPSFEKGKQLLTIEINGDYREAYDNLRDKQISIEIKAYHPKRSLNANAYAWVLINKIANAIGSTEDEVYLECLKDYGQSMVYPALPGADVSGYFKYFDTVSEGVLNGKPCVWYRVYKGSSQFDSAEMARFIDGVISEAKGLGIETETPQNIELMKQRWESKYGEK